MAAPQLLVETKGQPQKAIQNLRHAMWMSQQAVLEWTAHLQGKASEALPAKKICSQSPIVSYSARPLPPP